jgi:rRNA small subunit pseudouridine methyltransferase Nep1
MVLTLILCESSIELVPGEIVHHPAVLNWARRKKKGPGQMILDQSYHYAAMKSLGQGLRRGRPDIAHLCLLAALGTPLNMDGGLRCIIHTSDDRAIRVNPKTRLPRNTDRFVALLEQLYEQNVVPRVGTPLLTLEGATMQKLISELGPESVIALTTAGPPKPMVEIAARMVQRENPVLLVGGFPSGHFSKQTLNLAGESFRIDRRGLEAWIVVARAVYDYERAIVANRV